MRLEVTRKSDLALQALHFLNTNHTRVKGTELAAVIDSTPGFLSQVLNPLVRNGWVRSDPGPSGGYSLIVSVDDISILQVIEAVEGPTSTGRCVLADRPCDAQGVCAMHFPWTKARTQLLSELDSMSVADSLQPS